MQVRFLGFSFSSDCATVSLDDYVNHMLTEHGKSHELNEHDRFLFFNTTHSKNYYVGLLVTVKDQKTFCELVKKSGKLVVKVNALDDNSSLMDFNFLVLHKTSGFGMYQYYHQSFSLSSFGYFNAQRFSEFRDATAKAEISKIPDHKLTAAKEKAIKQKHKGRLRWEILVKKENLKDLIEELQQVKAFEYCFLALTAPEPEFQPLKSHVRKERTKLSFYSQSPVKALASSISNIVTQFNIDDGKIIGTDFDGIDRVLRITNNPDNFGEYSYDDVAPKINSLDIEQFEKSWVVEELLNKCAEYKHIFEAKAK